MCCVATHRESLLESQHHTPLTQKAPSWFAQVYQPRAAPALVEALTATGSGFQAGRARRKTLIAQDSQTRSPMLGTYASHVRPPVLTRVLTGA